MKKFTALLILSLLSLSAFIMTGCDEETAVDRAENAIESAQSAIGEAVDTKASQMADAAVGDMEIPEVYGETELPDIDELTE